MLSLRDVSLSPVVARAGEPFTLSLRIAGAKGSVVIARWHPVLRPQLLGLDSLILLDDGGNGDSAAGDEWCTVVGITLPLDPIGIVTESIATLSLHEPGEAHEDRFLPITLSFRSVDIERIPVPEVLELSGDARATSRVLSLALPTGQDLSLTNLETVVRRYYEILPDDRDILVVQHPPSVGTEFSGRSVRIRNLVRGIGLAVGGFRDFGSPERLQLVVQAAIGTHLRFPDRGSFCLLNHELAHR